MSKEKFELHSNPSHFRFFKKSCSFFESSQVQKSVCRKCGTEIGVHSQSLLQGRIAFEQSGLFAEYLKVSNIGNYFQVIDALKNKISLDRIEFLIAIYGTESRIQNTRISEEKRCQLEMQIFQVLFLCNGCIVTSGLGNGLLRRRMAVKISKKLGVIGRDYLYNSIAVCSWEKTINKEKFSNLSNPDIEFYPKQTCLKHLDPNHTFYAFVDGTTYNTEAKCREFKQGLENALIDSRYLYNHVLNILIDGELEDLQVMNDRIKSGMACIILKGFGGISDDVVEYINSDCAQETFQRLKIKNKTVIKEIEIFTKFYKELNRVEVVDINKDMNLLGELFFNVVACVINDACKLIKIAAFDEQSDLVAKAFDTIPNRNINSIEMQELFSIALIGKQLPVVNAMLEKGFSLQHYLTYDRLIYIYERAHLVNPGLGQIIKKSSENKDSSIMKSIASVIYKALGEGRVSKFYASFDHELNYHREIYIFCLFNFSQDLSFFFWKKTEFRLGGALFGALITRYIEKYYSKIHRNTEDMLQTAQKFEDMAITMLNTGWQSEEYDIMYSLLFHKQKLWWNVSCVELAEKGKSMKFFSEESIVFFLRQRWNGQVSYSMSGFMHVLCIVLFIPSLLVLPWKDSQGGVVYQIKGLFVISYKNVSSGEIVYLPANKIYKKWYNIFSAVYMSPFTKFFTLSVFYFTFSTAQSIALLAEFRPYGPVTNFETIIFYFMFILFVEEVRQLICQDCGWLSKPKSYFSQLNNSVDLCSCLFFIVGYYIHKQVVESRLFMDIVICLYAVSLIGSYCNLLYLLILVPVIGQYIIMIGEMLKDLIVFSIVIVFFIVAYGISFQAIIFPGNIKQLWTAFWALLFRPYTGLLGENWMHIFPISDNCTFSEQSLFVNCEHSQLRPTMAVILFTIFTLIVNILLLNLLIAIFSNTYDRINANSHLFYNVMFYTSGVQKFESKSLLPPPFTLFSFFFSVVTEIYRSFCPKEYKESFSKQSLVFACLTFDESLMKEASLELKPTVTLEDLTHRIDELKLKLDYLLESSQIQFEPKRNSLKK